jgi:peptidoglycan hydrolase-like amidase
MKLRRLTLLVVSIVIVLNINPRKGSCELTFPQEIEDKYGDKRDFEDYIKRVLAGELGYEQANIEALKALAVAARCAYMKLGGVGAQAQAREEDYWPTKYHQNHALAGTATIGEGLVYQSDWIRAHYYSHDCADFKGRAYRGHTKNSEDVYGKNYKLPYCREEPCPYCNQLLERHSFLHTGKKTAGGYYIAGCERGHGVGLCQYGAWALGENS